MDNNFKFIWLPAVITVTEFPMLVSIVKADGNPVYLENTSSDEHSTNYKGTNV